MVKSDCAALSLQPEGSSGNRIPVAGSAGLSADLMLSRCARKVIVFDAGNPRNAVSRGLHGYLTRDGTDPMESRTLGRAELARYPTVEVHDAHVTRAVRYEDRFLIETAHGAAVHARILLLATGRDDVVPSRPGFAALYGRGVYHCPVCDGWEHRGQSLVAYGRGEPAFDVAWALLTWSRRVTLCSDGSAQLEQRQRQRLKANGVGLREDEIRMLQAGTNGVLECIDFVDVRGRLKPAT